MTKKERGEEKRESFKVAEKILTYPIEVIIVKSLCDLDWLPFNLMGILNEYNEDKWMNKS